MTENNTTKAVDLITIHGVHLVVLERDGHQYIQAKPICDMLGMVWRSARRTLFSDDNASLYGTVDLIPPKIGGSDHTGVVKKGVTCIQIDRVYMLLARVSTGNMRARGNVSAADALLDLQKEWAKALHDYETKGVAINQRKRVDLATLISLIKSFNAATDPGQKASLNALVNEMLAELGHPVVDPQGSLDLTPRSH